MDVAVRHNLNRSGDPSGRPIVFVHGFGCDQRMWDRVAPAFEADHDVVLLDQVGAGNSDLSAFDPDRYATLHGYADDLVEVAEALDLRDAVLVGHSVSAMIGALATIRAPERFTQLVMIGASPSFIDDGEYVGGFSRQDIEELLETMERNYLGWSSQMAPVIMGVVNGAGLSDELEQSFCATDPTIANHFARTTFLADHREDLPHVPVPTLVLQVTTDALAPHSVGEFVVDRIPDARLAWIDGVGHCPHMSHPQETTAAIRSFLERRPANV